jgi:hypothetical protein
MKILIILACCAILFPVIYVVLHAVVLGGMTLGVFVLTWVAHLFDDKSPPKA